LISIYEYVWWAQPWVQHELIKRGLLSREFAIPRKPEITLTFAEAVELMRHDSYRRIRGAIRQMGNTVVIT